MGKVRVSTLRLSFARRREGGYMVRASADGAWELPRVGDVVSVPRKDGSLSKVKLGRQLWSGDGTDYGSERERCLALYEFSAEVES